MLVAYAFFAVAIGAGLAIQAPINAGLGRSVGGPLLASIISFATGAATICIFYFASGAALPDFESLRRTPWWIWIGGFLGAAYVFGAIVTAPRIGLASFVTLVVAGQMIAALAVDAFGLFGLEQQPISIGRIVGAACLVAGVVLMRWT